MYIKHTQLPVEVGSLQCHEKKHFQGLTKEYKGRWQDLFGKHNIKDAPRMSHLCASCHGKLGPDTESMVGDLAILKLSPVQSSIHVVQLVPPAVICSCAEIFRFPPRACVWSPCSCQPHGCYVYGERMPGCMGCECQKRGRQRECTSLFPWDYNSLGFEKTWCFFKSTMNFPSLCRL